MHASRAAIAGVTPDAITLAVGDGGNEVGFAKVAMKEEISQLTLGGESDSGVGENIKC